MNFDRVGRYWPETLSIVRIVVGLLFLEHGSAKLLGFPAPQNPAPAMMTLLWTQGVIELVGGLLLAIGLFTRPVAFILAGDMAVAYFTAHAPKNFFPLLRKSSRWRLTQALVKPDIDSLGFASTSSNLVDCTTGRSAGLMMCEMLAERPMLVEQRHAGRGICIQHLLGSDDLDLVRVDIEPSSDRAISSQASWIRCNFEKSQSAPSNRYPAVAVMARLSPACDGAETGRETPERFGCGR